jgi:hypothetical protein
MATFLVEAYAPRETDLARLTEEARAAATQIGRRGIDVRYVQTIFVPEDETCFHMFDAASAEAIAEGSRYTSLRAGRVVAAVASAGPSSVDLRARERGSDGT